jgi:hypothetical protein
MAWLIWEGKAISTSLPLTVTEKTIRTSTKKLKRIREKYETLSHIPRTEIQVTTHIPKTTTND